MNLLIGIGNELRAEDGAGLSREVFQGLEKLLAALRSESLLLEIPKALSQ